MSGVSAMRRTYLARQLASAPSVMTTGAEPCGSKPLVRFVTPSDVRDLKNRIDPFVLALDSTVATCHALPDGVAQGWASFSKTWRGFFQEDESWFHSAAQMDQAEAYECDLLHWQEMITRANKCAPDAPLITPEDAAGSGGSSGSDLSGALKTVAIAGAVIAAALGLRAVMR